MSESRTFSIRVPEDAYYAIEKYRRQKGISRNKAIVNAIRAIVVPPTPVFDAGCYSSLDVGECNLVSFDELCKLKRGKKKP